LGSGLFGVTFDDETAELVLVENAPFKPENPKNFVTNSGS
jgi:hypothetical protein